MKMKFFWIPARDSAAAEAELNAFLARSRVVQVEKSFCADTDGPGWSLCVQWLPGDAAGAEKPRGGESKVDYREVLDEPTFKIYSIPHDRLLALLRRKFKDGAFLGVMERVVGSFAVGNRAIPGPSHLTRGRNAPVTGLPFLGYRITPQAVLLGQRARRRFTSRLRAAEAAHQRGEITTAGLQRRTDALLAFTQVALCHTWRRGQLHSPGPQTPTVSCAAAPGTTRRRTAAPPSATGTTLATAGTTRACVCPQLTRAAAAARLTRSLEPHGLSLRENLPPGAGRDASRHLPNAPGGSFPGMDQIR